MSNDKVVEVPAQVLGAAISVIQNATHPNASFANVAAVVSALIAAMNLKKEDAKE